MKIKFILTALFAAVATSLTPAQVIVEDAGSIAQNEANQLVNLAKYVQMVENQVKQIETMTQELNQVSAYVKAFGDPAKTLNLSGVTGLVSGLQKSPVGNTLSLLQQSASGLQALENNGNGLYPSISNTALTGISVAHDPAAYKPFAALENATANYSNVESDVSKQRKTLKSEIASTLSQLQAATTDAETQKLQGILVAQSAQLHTLDEEVSHAASQTVVQDIANRNDRQKQQQAEQDEMEADREDGFAKFGQMMQPDTKPSLHFGNEESKP